MKPSHSILHSLRASKHVGGWLLQFAVAIAMFAAVHTSVVAQLSGTKTIGGGGSDYATIEAAIAALVANGVNGPVTFLIAGGTYTPPAGGYVLPAITSMSSTNTVTFKPASGATVTISGATNDGTATFLFDGGDYYIVDGSNSNGGTTRDMLIRQTSTTYSAAVWMRNDADYNVVKNTTLQSANGTGGVDLARGGVTVFVGLSNAGSGNDSNLIQNNMVGDPNGTYRSFRAIYIYGQSTAVVNVGTKVIGNDVVNFGNVQSATYGIFVSYHNSGTIVRNNTLRMTTASGTTFSQVYAIYCNEQLVSTNGNSKNVTFDGNRIHSLLTTYTSGELIYGITYFGDNNTNSSTVRIVNNTISNDRGTNGTQFYGMYFSVSNTSTTVNVHHNSTFLAGSGSFCYMLYVNTGGSSTFNHRNNIYYSTSTGPGYGLYIANTSGWNSNNNLFEFNTSNTGAYTAYYNGNQQTLQGYKTAASPNESNSVGGNPRFVNPSSGDLHISTVLPTPVESRGATGTNVTLDMDGDARSTTAPDIGADEGNFNGGGLTITEPNGGEIYLSGTPITIRYDAARPMSVRLEFSSNNGATWSLIGNVNPTTTGNNTFNFTLPDIATTQARIRVNNVLNPIEGDTTNAAFSIVQPSVSIISPNGGESFYQGDIVPIRWSSTDIPSDKRVMLEYSVDAGANWVLIATNLPSNNSSAANSYNWSIPSIRTDLALVRVSMVDRAVTDRSDRVFSILKAMNLLSPNGGEQWYVGDRQFVKFKVNQIDRIDIELSTDGGQTWRQLASRVWTRLDSFQITVPNTPTTNALVRIANSDNTTFTEQSVAPFSILLPAIRVVAPNGGEKYELNEPVTVRWTADNVQTLHLEYNSGNGQWLTVATGIDATTGAFTFTPPGFPTRLARVRLTDEARPRYSDASDGPFEIMEAPGISVFSPSQGEEIMRGSIYEISWQANRVGAVHIEYSSNGGAAGSWQRIVSNLPAGTSSYLWSVPTSLTSQGKIRVVQAAGSITGESGIFSIIEPRPTVHVRRPNGGEVYTSGENITISWTSALVATVALQYSSDGGASWHQIPGAENLPATPSSFNWIAPQQPGTTYRVRVVSGALSDDSDNNFTINRAIVPGVTVLYPNGGENFAVDSVVSISWILRDAAGDVGIDLSTDGGVTWANIDTVDGTLGSYSWTVPNTLTKQALVRVSSPLVSDQSDAMFEISRRIVPAIALLSPNTRSTRWTEGDTVDITWTAQDVPLIDIQLSTDGGTTWSTTIARNVDATLGTYEWRVPRLADTISNSLIVRVASSAGGSPADESDEPFEYRPRIISGVVTGMTGELRAIGVFPNPFSMGASLRWSQPASADVAIRVFARDGRLAREISVGRRDAGINAVTIDAGDIPTGVYVYEIRVGSEVARGTMTIVR